MHRRSVAHRGGGLTATVPTTIAGSGGSDTGDHRALRDAVREFVAGSCSPAVLRDALDADDERLPGFWRDAASLGWLGVHVGERFGGGGGGLPEAAIVAEEFGRALAPGPVIPAMHAAAVLAAAAGSTADELLPGVVDGSRVATVGIGVAPIDARPVGDGWELRGSARPLIGGRLADVVLLPARHDDETSWFALDLSKTAVGPLDSLDPTRRLAEVDVDPIVVTGARRLPVSTDTVERLAVVLYAAEAVGIARWCLETAVEHAKTRVQFGRPIGVFQAVKHRCSDLLVAVEQAAALTWDAARAPIDDDEGLLAQASAAALAFDVAVRAAKDCIQVLGGIGFTWEHDAHVYLRRALSVRQLLGPTGRWRARCADLAVRGVRRPLHLDLSSGAADGERHRADVREFLDSLDGLDDAEVRRRIVDAGYLSPHWPRPWGRDAGAREQLVIDEEFARAGVRRPTLAVGAWVVPTLIEHGSDSQRDRWIRPTLLGELTWCQLFSEPGAGSDLAALTTRAERNDNGWLVTGQKVWTSMARQSTHAILLARTAPATAADRRAGITYFVLDMTTPGIDVRPLRELTGQALFNEVFLDEVFVPDEGVVGSVGDGWRLARTTLSNERVQMGSGSQFGTGVDTLVGAVGNASSDSVVSDRLGALVAEARSLALMSLRSTLRALAGAGPGPESSLRKLLAADHEQRVQEFGLELLGPEGATATGVAANWTYGFLVTRCLTIAGGTTEVQRNVIGERLLGLPRDRD